MKASTPIAVLLLGLLALAGCGGGNSPSTPSQAPNPDAPNSVITDEVGPARLVANTEGPGPEVAVPEGPPPKKLVVVELKKGKGEEAEKGDTVGLRYVGVEWNGEIHSNSWTYSRVLTFKLGTIALSERGLDEGIRGMKVGGRREVVIPANRRYYPNIEGATTTPIVYVVDLVKIVD
ncbi:MAG TPA: FKBP-type peptidyl-prolyl cis-trans isomerase [Solirubrobacterales bacterium]|jgi:peptidylprolyl isomerase|nr:FKBP-type peptidyl-prolyl cis-trans isomerase [Solirubrobacterales bacterium]